MDQTDEERNLEHKRRFPDAFEPRLPSGNHSGYYEIMQWIMWIVCLAVFCAMVKILYSITDVSQRNGLTEKFDKMYAEKYIDNVSFDDLQNQTLTKVMSQVTAIAVSDMAESAPDKSGQTGLFLDKTHTLRELSGYLRAHRPFVATVEDHVRWLTDTGVSQIKSNEDYRNVISRLKDMIAHVVYARREFPDLQVLTDRLKDMRAAIKSEAQSLTNNKSSNESIVTASQLALDNLEAKIDEDRQISAQRSQAHHEDHRHEKNVTCNVIQYAELLLDRISRRVRQEQALAIGARRTDHSQQLHYLPALGLAVQGLKQDLNRVRQRFDGSDVTPFDTQTGARRKRQVEEDPMPPTTEGNDAPLAIKLSYDTQTGGRHKRQVEEDPMPPTTEGNDAPIAIKLFEGEKTRRIHLISDFSTVEGAFASNITLGKFREISNRLNNKYANVQIPSSWVDDKECVEVTLTYNPNKNRKMTTTSTNTLCYDSGTLSIIEIAGVFLVITVISILVLGVIFFCLSYFKLRSVANDNARVIQNRFAETNFNGPVNRDAAGSETGPQIAVSEYI